MAGLVYSVSIMVFDTILAEFGFALVCTVEIRAVVASKSRPDRDARCLGRGAN
jgi:hypothetical protein